MAVKKSEKKRSTSPEVEAERKLKLSEKAKERWAKIKSEKAAEQGETEIKTETMADVKEEKDTPVKTAGVPKEKTSDELDLLRKQVARQEEMLNQFMAQNGQHPLMVQNQKDRREEKFGKARRKEIPAHDRLSAPKTYIYLGGTFLLNVYKIDGSEVYPPYDTKIHFVARNSDMRRDNQGNVKWAIYSTFSTQSKLECKYIEESPEYNVVIFDRINKVKTLDPHLVEQVKRANEIVKHYDDIQLMNEARSYKIDMNLTMDNMRSQVISYKLAEIVQMEQTNTASKAQSLFTHDLNQRNV
jgi:hypothetical protein